MSAASRVARWNRKHAEGCPVSYRRDDGTVFETHARSAAQVLPGGTDVIWVDGIAGCVALERVTERAEGK